MGTTLTGTQINNTYDGLIKTTDNTAITATTKLISDGLGNDTCIKVGTAGTDFLGAVDFSAATVTGLPTAAAGLVSGTGADSMQSDASLTTVAANAAGACSIALGDNASTSLTSVSIGRNAKTDLGTGGGKVAVGVGSCACGDNGISIGNGAQSNGQSSISLGILSDATANHSISIGRNTQATGACSIAIGLDACVQLGVEGVAIGRSASNNPGRGVAIGKNTCANVVALAAVEGANAGSNASIAIGWNSSIAAANAACCAIAIGNSASVSLTDGISIGSGTTSSAIGAVALGNGVIAATADTVSVKALETQTASTPTAGGIIMVDAGSTSRRLNIDASGNLQIDSTPVGGGGAAGLVNGTGTNSLKNADSLVTTPAAATGLDSIALGNAANAVGQEDVIIGPEATSQTLNKGGTALGSTTVVDDGAVAIGRNAQATGIHSIAIGGQCNLFSTGCTRATGTGAIAIGESAAATSNCSVIIGKSSSGGGAQSTVVGGQSSTAWNGTAVGFNSIAGSAITGDGPVAIGSCNTASGNGSIAIGWRSSASGACTYVIGESITSSRACTLVTHQVESTVAGKGIVVTSPDGLTTLGIGIDNTGAIVTYTP